MKTLQRLKVTISEEHIRNGIPGRARCCPIAICLNEMGAKEAYVGAGLVNAFNCLWKLSGRAREFVYAYDDDQNSVKPSTFILSLESGPAK